MAVTQNSYTGNGSTTNYSFTFPYLETTDVKVKLDGVDTTAYSFANATTVQMNSAPANGAKIIIYRNTGNDTKPATFYAGSAIKSEDLNNNYDQILYAVQEIDNNAMSTLGDTAMQGDMLIGQGFGLQFEGATDDAHETRLIAADPTADRVITLPNETGTVILNTNNSIDISDNTKIKLGTGDDLEIYTDGSNSYIKHNGDGDFRIFSGNAESIKCAEGANVSLYHNGTEMAFTHANGFKLNDTKKLLVGTGNDLQLYHSGTHSYLDNNTGSLIIRTNVASDVGGDIFLKPHDDKDGISIVHDGSVKLYYNGVGPKVATVSDGLEVMGDLHLPDSTGAGGVGEFTCGAGQDLKVYHDGSNSYITNAVGHLNIDTTYSTYLRKTGGEEMAIFVPDGSVSLFHNGTKKFETSTGGASVTGTLTATAFSGDGSALTNVSSTLDATANLDLNDNVKVLLGTGDDLQIYHSGTQSYISDQGTGNLNLQGSSKVVIGNAAHNENMAQFFVDGAVELYNNNVKRLETTSSGVTVTGNITTPSNNSGTIGASGTVWADIYSNAYHTPDNGKYLAGTGGDLEIYHTGSDTYIDDVGTGRIHIRGNDGIHIQSYTGTEELATFLRNGAVELYYDNSTTPKFSTTSDGSTIDGKLSFSGTGTAIKANDNREIEIGSSSDLKIFHNGTNSYIQNQTGNLVIASNRDSDTGGDIWIDALNGERSIKCVHNGGVSLYWDGTPKLETHETKVSVDVDFQLNNNKGIFFDGAVTARDTIWRNSTENSLNIAGRAQVNVFIDSNNDDTNAYFAVNKDHTTKASATELFKVDNNGNVDVTGNITTDDDKNIELGNSSDLKIYHNGTNNNSYIDNNTGSLIIRTNVNADVGGDIFIKPHDNEDGISVLHDGSVRLHYDGSADPKMATVSDGIELFGDIHLPDSTGSAGVGELTCGAGQDLKIYHDGTHSYIYNNTGDLRLFNSNDTEAINCQSSGNTSLYYDGTEMAFTHASGFKLNDNKILLIGTGNDLQIKHNGSNSYIENTLGHLYIDTTYSTYFRNSSGVDTAVFDHTNGAYLKYQGSIKFNTHNTGVTVTGELSVTDKVTQTTTAVSALAIDCSTSNYFTKAITGNSTFTFTNVPASGTAYGMVVELDVTGSNTSITWPTEVKWPSNTDPTYTDTKTHVFSFVTVDGGTTWRGAANVDYVT